MKKVLCIALALTFAFGMAALTGCGNKEEPVEETTTTATTTEPTTTTEATTKKKTYKDLYESKLDALIEEYGGVNCGRLIDMDASGVPEMIVFSGVAPNFAIDIFTINEDNEVVNIYEETFSGLRYWQSDASYEIWINESISPTTISVFDSSDEWKEDKIIAVSLSGGATSTETLVAKAKGEPDTPDWSECKCSINGETVSASEYEAERDRLETGSDKINPASSDVDSLRSELQD